MTRAEEILLKEMRYIASISNGQVKRVAEGAIKSAREYLATEPSGERANLIEKLRLQRRWLIGSPASIVMMEDAADMLEADAQQAKRVPMTPAEITSSWDACIDNRNRVFEIRTEFARAIEAHHGITPK